MAQCNTLETDVSRALLNNKIGLSAYSNWVRLLNFRITKYRSILDSGTIEMSPLVALVGKNESGKSSLLQALYKTNPLYKEPYDIDREWPRNERSQRDVNETICFAEYELTSKETEGLSEIFEDPDFLIQKVDIWTDYEGNTVRYGNRPFAKYNSDVVGRFVHEQLSTHPFDKDKSVLSFIKSIPDHIGMHQVSLITRKLNDKKELLSSVISEEITAYDYFLASIGKIAQDLTQFKLIESKADEFIKSIAPKFIYLDEYSTFRGTAKLSDVYSRHKANTLTNEDKTFITLLFLAGMTIEREYEKSTKSDTMQRQLDIDEASKRFTRTLKDRWTQKEYKVRFVVDGDNFYTFIEDLGDEMPIHLEERSKGFKWFFSFDLTLSYGLKNDFKNTIILLDEPGLYLHPDAQIDMVKRLEEYSKESMILYTTHLPFMIDLGHPERIAIVRETKEGTKVDRDILVGEDDSKLVLQSALGMNYVRNYFIAPKNIVTEGVHDYWLITAYDNLLSRLNKDCLPETVLVSPSRGARAAALLTTFMIGQKLHVICLLDSDAEGESAFLELRDKWLLRVAGGKAKVLRTSEILSTELSSTIEDLIPEKLYFDTVKEVHGEELRAKGVKRISLPSSQGPILERVESYLKSHDIRRFNKGSVMKAVCNKLNSMNVANIEPDTVNMAERVINHLRQAILD